MVDIGRYHSPARRHLTAHKLGRDVGLDAQRLAVHVFADGHILHLFGDDAPPGARHLCAVAALRPRLSQWGQSAGKVDFHVGIAVGPARVVDHHGLVLHRHAPASHRLHGGREPYAAHPHPEVGIDRALHVHLLR